MRFWRMLPVVLSVLAVLPAMACADEASPARQLGEAGRAIADQAREVYESSRDGVIDAGRGLSEDARQAYEEVGTIGPRIVDELENGLQGKAPAPSSPDEAASSPEAP